MTMRQRAPYCFNMAAVPEGEAHRLGVVDAALRCLARSGVAKTSLDDVAREAGLSRATLYRLFPGGREAVLRAVVETEAERLFADLGAVMGKAEDLDEMVVAGITATARRATAHPALSYLLTHEPGTILPHLTFAGLDRVLAAATTFAAPLFGRWLEPEAAERAAEWTARVVISYLVCPGEEELSDPSTARRVASSFILPGIRMLPKG